MTTAARKFKESEIVAELIKTWYEGYTSLKTNYVESLGLDCNTDLHEIGNFRIKKEFLGGYGLSVIDSSKGLDGTLIRENKRFIYHLQDLFKHRSDEIHEEDLKPFFLDTKIGTYHISNFCLSQIFLSKKYRITLIDERKGVENKWTDHHSNSATILTEIKEFEVQRKKANRKEKTLEEDLATFLKDKFENVNRQVSIGGIKALKIDLDIGNGKFGIELKLAKEVINSTQKQRLIGQLHDYVGKKYNSGNILLLVAGDEKTKPDTNLRELESLVEKHHGGHYHYMIH